MDSQEAILDQMRKEIAHDYRLHLDDDGSEIDDILFEEVEGTDLERYLI